MKLSKVYSPKPCYTKTGSTRHHVYGNVGRKKYRKYFSDIAEATAYYHQLQDLEANYQAFQPRLPTSLSREQIADAETAFNRLSAERPSASLTETVKEILDQKPLRISVAFFEFLTVKATQNINTKELEHYKTCLRRFSEANPELIYVHEISSNSIKRFFEHISRLQSTDQDPNNTFAGCTISSYIKNRSRLMTLLNWLASGKSNFRQPVHNIFASYPTISLPEKLILILKPEQGQQLMDDAERFEDSKLVNYFSHSIFITIRTGEDGEIFRLATIGEKEARWDHENRKLEISGSIAKKCGPRRIASKRDMQIADPFYHYKKLYPIEDFPIIPQLSDIDKSPDPSKRLKNALERFRRFSNTDLGHNVLRHTTISNLLGMLGEYAETARQAGNSESVIRNHYDGKVSKEQAERFYKIRPLSSPERARG